MGLQLGDTAPDFSAVTTTGYINFHQWAGNDWVILFSHPKDFTPVCTTELGYVARLKPEFDKRGVKAIGLSVDSVDSHRKWADDIRETQGYTLNFPLIADLDREVARLYGMIHPQHDEVYTVRTVFVIDPKKKIRLTLTYPQTAGRNFDEILRVVDSLQLTDSYSVSTPVNWEVGRDVIIIPSVSDSDAELRFPSGWRAAKPYLRFTPDPRSKPHDIDLDSSG
ncbi:MAG: thioredoxin-dependent peroxiredoxin [Gammaproteobacteria bacterium]|jgi:alkyl hydroperoxide reductase subunit AhpC|nr:thioredoxin-dependent peroxiredoxin [Gammaproteobacteria bacterium]